ncbi:MAG: sigma-70 family RNA polymerase sigma factor [Myxococcales bacterium]|nr:sigma-70 family RNA polymerase sigma factor [Myxococcales bacterium]
MTTGVKAAVIPIHRGAMKAGTLSDEALVAACATGDAQALAQLFDRLCDDVARLLGRLAHVDAQDVPDLVQEVFLAVFQNAHRYERRAGVKTWVLAIAGNLARARTRKIVRGRKAKDELERALEAPQASTPEEEVITADLVQRLVDPLAALPHDLEVAFLLCDVEELPGVEVAAALGVPKGTLYRRLHEARRRLRAALEGGVE